LQAFILESLETYM